VSGTGRLRGRWLARHRGGPRHLLALDLETTGLDPARAEVIAVGTVPVVDGAVQLGAASATLVRPVVRSAEEGIVAHHLRPSDVADAPELAAVVPGLLRAIAAADALLVHHAPLDVAVLRRACATTGLPWPGPPVIDTVDLIARVRARQRVTARGRRLARDLAGARTALGLPPYPAHDAATDAIATAELYLALQVRLSR
jgi:DNA polymerase III subunit epsilon